MTTSTQKQGAKMIKKMKEIKSFLLLYQLYIALLVMRLGKSLVPNRFKATRQWLKKFDFEQHDTKNE